MRQILTTSALAIVLLAGAGGAALAQEQHDRGGGQAAPQGHPGGGPGGGHFQGAPAGRPAGPPGGHFEGHPGGRPPGPPGGGAPHGGEFRGPPASGFHREERPQGPGAQVVRPPGGASERHFQGPPPAQHFEGRRPEAPPSGFHREGAPPTVVQGGRPEHGRGGHFEAWGGRPGAPPPHWSAGRYPPVMGWRGERFHVAPYYAPYGYYSRAWRYGDFLPRPWFARSYWLLDFLSFDLPYPPPGFVWVRVGPDAMLIDEYTGRIVQVVQGIFWW